MTNQSLQEYYNELMALCDSGQLKSLANEDRRHNATILCLMLNTSNIINMYCGEMSIFREKFYDYIDKTNPGEAEPLKQDMIDALDSFINKSNTELNIIVENYSDRLLFDNIANEVFRKGIKDNKINIRKMNKKSAMTLGLTHCVYTDNGTVRIEENVIKHSGMFLANISTELFNDLKCNFEYLTQSSDPLKITM